MDKTLTIKEKVYGSKQQTEHVFLNDLEVGKYGEYMIKKFFQKVMPNAHIEDKSDDSRYQKADIDLLVQYQDKNFSVEVKNDRTLFENLFYETTSNKRKNGIDTPGCMLVTEATYLVYYYQATKVAAILPVKNFNIWVRSYLEDESNDRFRTVTVPNKGYLAEGFLIPLEEIFGENGVPGARLQSIVTRQTLSYEEYDNLRKYRRSKIKANYADVQGKVGWERRNELTYPNKNKLNVELLDDNDRIQRGLNRLSLLNVLNNNKATVKV